MTVLPWSQIDTVLLDMDGTLLDLHFDNFFWLDYLHQCYAQQHCVSLEQAKDHIVPLLESYQGQLKWYCVEFWTEKLQLPIREMKREQAALIAPREYALEFLHALQQAGKRTVLVTNAHRHSLEIKLERVNLAAGLDAIVSSHDYGYPKERQEFWQHLQQHFPFAPQRTLFMDDSLSVLRSAQRYGIHHLRCITQPDSRGPHQPTTDFIPGNCFATVLTGL